MTIMSIPEDRSYTELVSQLEKLNNQFSAFLNESGDVLIDSGKIPSLRKVIEDVKKIRYIKQVISYRTFAEAESSMDAFEELNDIVEVYADGERNGFYRKFETSPGVFNLNRVSYVDIAGAFPDRKGDEYDHHIEVEVKEGSLFFYDVEKSEVENWVDVIRGDFKYFTDSAIYTTDFKINICLLGNENKSEVVTAFEYASNTNIVKPELQVRVIDNGTTYTIVVVAVAPEIGKWIINLKDLQGGWYTFV